MAHPAPSTASDVRLAAGCQFRAADDTLPVVVANLVALGFDLIYLVDHLNESIPLAQLQALTAGRSELRIIRKQTAPYAQSGVHSLLLRMAQNDGAHAYLHVDADEFPAPIAAPAGSPASGASALGTDGRLRDAVHAWLVRASSIGLLVPHQNVLQRRDVERWGVETLTAPTRFALGPAEGIAAADAGYFARSPNVRAIVRLEPGGLADRWVRWGSHRVRARRAGRVGGQAPVEVSPDLVMLHLPYPSRRALESRRGFRERASGVVVDNRGSAPVQWEDVSLPAHPADPHPGPRVRTAPTAGFDALRERLRAAGLLEVLADETLAAQRTALVPTDADAVFAAAADLLTATIVPRDDREGDDGDGDDDDDGEGAAVDVAAVVDAAADGSGLD
ncbi:MAG: hypothetical protein ACO1N6_01040 [Microcella sp.]